MKEHAVLDINVQLAFGNCAGVINTAQKRQQFYPSCFQMKQHFVNKKV